MYGSVAQESCSWGWRSGSDLHRHGGWEGVPGGALTPTFRVQALGEAPENQGHLGSSKQRE